MKLAFSGEARYTDFSGGYELYLKRCRNVEPIDVVDYKRIVRIYCASLAERLCKDGIADLPNGIGQIAAAVIPRKPKYRDNKFLGYGKKDWKSGQYDGSQTSFGIVFLPNRGKNMNLRCYGFVANRKLYGRMKELYDMNYRPWMPVEFNDDLI